MSLMSRNFHGSNGSSGSNDSFHPLFRLLDDFDNYSRQGRGNRNHVQSFQPKFDVREVEDAFELHGELAGINRENVHIEFSDPHTLHIHGRVERSYTSGTPPAGLIGSTQTSGAITESGEEPAHKTSHNVTVEDENATDGTTSATPAEATTTEAQNTKSRSPSDTAKYWVSERSIGEFNRTFNFPGHIQQDAVTANLTDGILTVRVPKAPKHETRRRIQIN